MEHPSHSNIGAWNIHALTVKVNNHKLNKLDDLEFQKGLITLKFSTYKRPSVVPQIPRYFRCQDIA